MIPDISLHVRDTGPTTARKRVLIYYMDFPTSIGGGEFLPLLFIAELQKTCEVTLALNWKSDVGAAAAIIGVPLDLSKLKIVLIKPENDFLCKLDAILPFYRTWQLKKLAKQADVCISTANMMDFGKPAHHFVYLLKLFGDNAFLNHISHTPPLRGFARFRQELRTLLAENILRPLLGIRSTRTILSDPREHIYPNSCYVDSVMRGFYGPFTGTVFYPPTIFEVSQVPVPRDPHRILYLGRICQEKNILDIVRIVESARMKSGTDLTLHLAGPVTPDEYGDQVRRVAEEKPWIRLVGPVYAQDKADFLGSGNYAVHTRRDEEFGISITEYLKAGCVPIVPDDGGSREIVDSPALTYHTNEEAADILTRLLQDEAFREEQRAHYRKRAGHFSRETYLATQQTLLNSILHEPDRPSANTEKPS